MAGGVWRQLLSALQFLGLIDSQKVTKDAIGKLVKAHGTPEWAKMVKDLVLPAYDQIVDGLPLDRATSQQLEKCFREHGKVDGQMADKCIRFYLHALKDAGVKYSALFLIRKDRSGKKSKPRTKPLPNGSARLPKPEQKAQPDTWDENSDDQAEPVAVALHSYPLYFKGKPTGVVRIPEELDNEDLKVIELTLSVIKAYAAQKPAAG